jgi:predicted peptidase
MSMTSGSDAIGRLRAVTHSAGYHYLLALPEGYTPDPQRRWPLMLCLHGAADRGSDLFAITRQGVPRLLAAPPDLSSAENAAAADVATQFIVLAPQCPHYEVWDNERLLELLDHAHATLRVDAARVYLVGLSMGGFGAWSLGMRHPERFAALVATCGGGRVADVLASVRDRPAELRRLGVWAFHGAKDTVVPVDESQRMIAALEQAGVHDVRLTVYPDAGHDAWSQTFVNRELYAWLLRHAH